ncbi:Uncharacterized protein Fot_24226 [Forsythia ovata]|uniref:Uncharacterized protein n=1 Tax=Forsythia ovata TaxID=205694 RepID=A0ABD1U5M2_9LAMI
MSLPKKFHEKRGTHFVERIVTYGIDNAGCWVTEDQTYDFGRKELTTKWKYVRVNKIMSHDAVKFKRETENPNAFVCGNEIIQWLTENSTTTAATSNKNPTN